jgi:hypothetical protein
MTPELRRVVTSWLLLALAAVAVVLVLVTRRSVTSSEVGAREHSLLKVFREDEITRIEIEGHGQGFAVERGEAPRDASEFHLVKPVSERAKREAVDELLRTLRYASYLRQVDEESLDRTALGLESPRWVLHLWQGDTHYRLRLGQQAPQPSHSHYLEVTGENVSAKGVFVVREGLVQELTLDLADFRSHTLAPIGKGALSELRFEGALAAGRCVPMVNAGGSPVYSPTRWRTGTTSTASLRSLHASI